MLWEEFFGSAFQEVRQRLENRYHLEDDGSGPPNRVAIRALIDRLPCPVKVVELQFDRKRHPHLRDDVCPAIIYDLANLGHLSVETLGVVDAYDHAKVVKVLTKSGLPHADAGYFAKELQGDAKIMGFLDTEGPQMALQFSFSNPLKDPDQFVWDLEMHLENWLKEIRKPIEAIDYCALYHMKSLPVLTRQKLLAAAPATRNFVRWTGRSLQPLSLSELQRRVRRDVLIPPVPEAVQRVFARARDLYVFGYFKYEFFTVAQHQAVLALEVAIKHRYCQALGDAVTLRTGEGKETVLHRPDYERIWRSWKEAKKRLTVNGTPFRPWVPELLDWLVENKIVTKWERKECDHYREVRDHLSHPTLGSTWPPGYAHSAVKDVAQLINKMFHREA
jgi:hypothetical protein